MWPLKRNKELSLSVSLSRPVCVCVCVKGSALIKPSLHSTHNHTLTRLYVVVSQSVCYAGSLFKKHCSTRQGHTPSHAVAGKTLLWWLFLTNCSHVYHRAWPGKHKTVCMCEEQHSFFSVSGLWQLDAQLRRLWFLQDQCALGEIPLCFRHNPLWSTLTRSLPLMSQPLKPVVNTHRCHQHTGHLENKFFCW